MKIHTMTTEMFHADTDGQTGMTKLNSRFSSFANARKNM